MNHITNFAESFMKLFQLGGETFISWMTNIVPLVFHFFLISFITLLLVHPSKKCIKFISVLSRSAPISVMFFPFEN